MKKIFITFLIGILIILTLSVSSYAKINYDKINKQSREILTKALEQYIEAFKDESVPEEERILDYSMSGYGVRDYAYNEVSTKYSVRFQVTPVNKDNTIWLPKNNIIFVDLNYENDEFTIERISDKPENWDKFVERYEEYKINSENNKPISEEKVAIVGKDTEFKNNQIVKMSNYIYIIGAVIIFSGILFIIVKVKKLVMY